MIAPRVKGLKLSVFTLPSFEILFKLIKDKFDPSKNVTRQIVLDKYHLVKVPDRVDRMADKREFSNLSLPLKRFDSEYFQKLVELCGNLISVTDDQVVIKHLYTWRRMTPLNIFPGYILLKTFGVTRHRRITSKGRALF